METSDKTIRAHSSACLSACLIALALAAPRPALAHGTEAWGLIGGEYVLKNGFTADNAFIVARQGREFRFSLALLHATQHNDGSLTSNGTTEGSFSVKNCRTHFDDPVNECRFEFAFKGRDAVSIVQEGSCLTFGANIDATGIYKKK